MELDSESERLEHILSRLEPAVRSEWVISRLRRNSDFEDLCLEVESELLARDQADEVLLATGVEYAMQNGELPAKPAEISWTQLSIDGKNPDEVAREVDALAHRYTKEVRVIAISGMSGVGKGTTVAALTRLDPWYTSWSNGDVFRFIAWLVQKSGENAGETSVLEAAVRRIGQHLQVRPGVGVMHAVDGVARAEVADSELRGAEISAVVPLVARFAQGIVIRLLQSALASAPLGSIILIEGRRTTLQFAKPDLGVELVCTDRSVLSIRRAGQRIADAILDGRPPERLLGLVRHLSTL